MGNAKWLLSCLAAVAGIALLTMTVAESSKGMLDQVDGGSLARLILGVIVAAGVIAFVVWLISVGVALGVKSASAPQEAYREFSPPMAERAFPVVLEEVNERPGTFRVIGVDHSSGLDVTDHIAAESAANAKVKAELRGIVVTRIDRV